MLRVQSNTYVPILSTKTGERQAISELDDGVMQRIVPIFVVKGPDWDYARGKPKKEMGEHLSQSLPGLAKAMAGHACFIDARELADEKVEGTQHPLNYAVEIFRAEDCEVVPVVSPNSTVEYRSAVQECIAEAWEICIRLGVGEWEHVTNAASAVFSLISSLGATVSTTHLVFDCGLFDPGAARHFANSVLPSLAYPEEWASITFAASSMPRQMPAGNGMHEVARPEWAFYEGELVGSGSGVRIPSFGDYGVESAVPPSEIDPRFLNPSNNLRYLTGDKWLIPKAGTLKKTGSAPLVEVLERLSRHGEFEHGYSMCEEWVCEVIGTPGRSKAGNSRVWRKYGTVRHLSKMAELLNLPLAIERQGLRNASVLVA